MDKYSRMTIDEAISHALEVAGEQQERTDGAEMIDVLDGLDVEACKECAADHRQLAEWLRELKERRQEVEKLKKELEVAKMINHAEFKTLCKYNHKDG